jgi:predicted MFS family arabinose efflux permease
MAAIPVLALTGGVALWHIYAVAAVFGLFKILPIGIIPAVLPELVPKKQLPTAIALEAVGTGAAGLAGPALGGVLVPLIGAEWLLALDAATYLIFAAAVLSMKAPLARPPVSAEEKAVSPGKRGAWGPVVAFIIRDRVMLVITIAFTAFNVAMGMLIVTQPWLAHERLAGGAVILGALVGTLAAAEMIGSLIAGAIRPARRPMFRIGLLQIVAGGGLLLMLGANPYLILIAQVVCGLPAALLTVSSQTVRYQRTPEHLRARTMTLMRTMMLGAVPVGSALAGVLLDSGSYTTLVVVMAVIAGAPGLLSVVFVRSAVVNPDEPAAAAAPVEPATDPTVPIGPVDPAAAESPTLARDGAG